MTTLHTIMNRRYKLLVLAREHGDDLKQWLDEYHSVLVTDWPGLIQQGPEGFCFRITAKTTSGASYFLKAYPKKSSRNLPFLWKLSSKAWRSLRRAHKLSLRGIPTPVPIAYALILAGPNRGMEILVTEWLENVQPLGPFSDHFFAAVHDQAWMRKKRDLARKLGFFMGKLHQQSIYHGDLNINNILVQSGGKHMFYLIDTGDIRSMSWISNRRVFKNLDEVNRFFLDTRVVSRTDRLRFLTAYLERESSDKRRLRYYWRRIEKRTNHRLKIHHKHFIT